MERKGKKKKKYRSKGKKQKKGNSGKKRKRWKERIIRYERLCGEGTDKKMERRRIAKDGMNSVKRKEKEEVKW